MIHLGDYPRFPNPPEAIIAPSNLSKSTILQNTTASTELKMVCKPISLLTTAEPAIVLSHKLYLNKPAIQFLLQTFPPTASQCLAIILKNSSMPTTNTIVPLQATVTESSTNIWGPDMPAYLGIINDIKATGITLGEKYEKNSLYTFNNTKEMQCNCINVENVQAYKEHTNTQYSLFTAGIFYILAKDPPASADKMIHGESITELEKLFTNHCTLKYRLQQATNANPISSIIRILDLLPPLYLLNPKSEEFLINKPMQTKQTLFLTPLPKHHLRHLLSLHRLQTAVIETILSDIIPLKEIITSLRFNVIIVKLKYESYIIRSQSLYISLLRAMAMVPSLNKICHG